MTRVRRVDAKLRLPDNLSVGDKFTKTLTVHVTEVTQVGIDVTAIGDAEPQHLRGEDECVILIYEGATVPGTWKESA